jgi:hypothetical protein
MGVLCRYGNAWCYQWYRRGLSCTDPREITLAYFNWLSTALPRRIILTLEVDRARRACYGEVAGNLSRYGDGMAAYGAGPTRRIALHTAAVSHRYRI